MSVSDSLCQTSTFWVVKPPTLPAFDGSSQEVGQPGARVPCTIRFRLSMEGNAKKQKRKSQQVFTRSSTPSDPTHMRPIWHQKEESFSLFNLHYRELLIPYDCCSESLRVHLLCSPPSLLRTLLFIPFFES